MNIIATTIKFPALVAGMVRLVMLPAFDALFTIAQEGGGAPVHEGKLKEAILVLQRGFPCGTYSVVYQKVQSSVASIAILL